MICPICSSEGSLLYKIKSDFITKKHEAYYQEQCPIDLDISDYDVIQCNNCTLQFSLPLKPGNDNYYSWISSHSSYYPEERWEWGIVLDKVRNSFDISPLSLLEVGCGTGEFLKKVRLVVKARTVGLDTTINSIEKCRDKKLEVYCETVEHYGEHSSENPRLFDVVVAFHCLEHVADPKEFVSAMKMLLKPSGKIYLSTPYSPMSFESVWFDPLNHPPHHITRWNEAAYRELARQLYMNIDFFMPDAASIIDRTLYALNLSWNGPKHLASNIGIQAAALMHPVATFKEIMRQKKRIKVNSKAAANVVLVELKQDNN